MAETFSEISSETAQALTRQAAANGLSVDAYLRRLLGVNGSAPQEKAPTPDELAAALDEFAEDVAPLPRYFSREDIYFPEG